MSTEFELFKGKNLSSLFEDIYNNQLSKKAKISTLIEELKKMIRHAGDVASIGPILSSLIDSSVKNDDQLVKLATIATKIIASEKKTEGQEGFLSAFEKEQLLKDLEETKEQVERVDDLEFELDELEKFDKILLSPGPGIPDEAGLLKDVIKKYASTKSIFGVCLGLQAIGEVFGGTLINLEKVYHGVATKVIKTEDDYIFNDLPNEIQVGRYHSWVINNEKLPADLIITSIDEKGQIMSIKHAHLDIRGVQYHPESVLTPNGKKILENWLLN